MRVSVNRLACTAFGAASVALAWHPVTWLVRTWTDPSYDSSGYLYLAAVLLLAMYSVLSGPPARRAPGLLGALLVGAAALRFLSQTLAVNLIGGLALAVDVYALAVLAGLDRRPKPLSPFWLAALFLFSLPLETVLERTLGFPLQQISAQVSCGLLGAVFSDTVCSGVRIGIGGQDVLVDLPCAGASGLMLMLALFAAISAVRRPGLPVAMAWGLAVLGLAVIGNSLRISVLSAGLVFGWDVMSDPLHSVIGLVTLGLSALPVVMFLRAATAPAATQMFLPARPLPAWARLPAAVGFLGLSMWIITLPASPLDVSAKVEPLPFPGLIANEIGRPVPLSPIEERYFRAYGGTATKAQYGRLGLNRISTTSPLRHLHSPEACLRGLGYRVRFLGTRYDDAPSAVYEATAPDGVRWLVSVTYASDTGEVVSSVGEAIWHWLNGRGRTWSSVQRITPLVLDDTSRRRYDKAALVALDIPIASKEPTS